MVKRGRGSPRSALRRLSSLSGRDPCEGRGLFLLVERLPASCTPLPGVTLSLYVRNEGEPAPGLLKRTTVSDASGFWYFVEVGPFAYYRIVAFDPAGYVAAGAWAQREGTVVKKKPGFCAGAWLLGLRRL